MTTEHTIALLSSFFLLAAWMRLEVSSSSSSPSFSPRCVSENGSRHQHKQQQQQQPAKEVNNFFFED